MTRLPQPGGDDSTWGDLLNGFLEIAHNSDGSLKTSALPIDTDTSLTANSDTKLASQKAVKSYVDAASMSGGVPDATTSSKGKIQLAGDLGGTAAMPTVPGLTTLSNQITALRTAQITVGISTSQVYDFNVADATNATATIQAAIDAAAALANGGVVRIMAGTYNVNQLVWKHNVNIQGEGIGRTVIRARNGLNNDLLITENFGSETDHNYNGYTTMAKVVLSDMSFDGNQGNQTGQSHLSEPRSYRYLVKFYGYLVRLQNLELYNCEGALYTEYSNNQPHDPFENYEISDSVFQNIFAKNYSRAGWVFRGPHDSNVKTVRLFGSDYDNPDFDFLADNNGNYGAQGSFVDDLHCRSLTTETGYNAIIKVGLNGTIYPEGGTHGNVLVQTSGCNLKFLMGFEDSNTNTTNDAAIVLASTSSANVTNNNITAIAYYGPINGDLVRLDQSAGGSVGGNEITTIINPGASITGSEYKLKGSLNGNHLISGVGQCGNIWDLTEYTGGNNSFETTGRKYRGGSYSYYLTAFTGSYSISSDYVWVLLDAYPDYERLHIYNMPDSTDGAVTFNGGSRRKYVRALLPNGVAADIVIAASDAPQSWKDSASIVCDGTADDVELNAAITQLYADGGGTLRLSPGTFYLAATLNLFQNTTTTTPTVKILGSGMNATYLQPASGVHAISMGKATQAWVCDLAGELAGSSDLIHDIDGLVSGDGIGWRTRHCRFENIQWSGLSGHSGWGFNIQPFRVIMQNLEGNTGRGSYTYPGNGVKLSCRSTPNTGATFNAGDSYMKRVQISLQGASGCKAIWLDTDDASTGDGSYFNQMTFEQIGTRSNVSGQGTGIQIGHSGSSKLRSIFFSGIDIEQFGIGVDLYNVQSSEFKTFFTGLVATGGIYFRTDNTGSTNNTVNNHWSFGGTVGVYGVTADVIYDLNGDANNPNIYENLFVETSGGTARINGSTSVALPAGVIVQHISGQQRTGTRHPALNDPLGYAMIGDSGSGGRKGMVPAPAAGDAAANKFLSAGGTWAVPSGSGAVTSVAGKTGAVTLVEADITNLTTDLAAKIDATGTATLTNKRITPRTSTATSSATPTINSDNVDYYSLTAQTVDITSFTTNLSGTPTDGQKLWLSITGTASRAITWGTSFESSSVYLPTTTNGTSRLDIGFIWNAATSKWRCIAVA